jgi:hypothetical protein
MVYTSAGSGRSDDGKGILLPGKEVDLEML